MKKTLRKISSFAFATLPISVQRHCIVTFLESKPPLDILSDEILSSLTRKFGTICRLVTGKYGTILGSIKDRYILHTYACNGVWAERTNHIIDAFFKKNNYTGTYLDIGANIGLTTIPVREPL